MLIFRQHIFYLFRLTVIFLSFFRSTVGAQALQADSVYRSYVSSDSNFQYSLYLPAGYKRVEKYPLIIFLDPAARGDLPVNKYRGIADEYGIIFAGSYTSRNFDPSASARSIAAIYDDLLSKYAIDTSRIWLAGFSGGARMATSFAENYSEIKGLIACGAGFAGEKTFATQRSIPFAGIVGNIDMNYEEMLGINEDLEASAKRNILILFNGGHQWPPPGYFGIAVCWLMKKGEAPGEMVQGTCSKVLQSIADDKDSGWLYPAWLMARELRKITAFDSRSDSQQQLIGSTKGFKQDQHSFLSVLNEERKYMDEFSIEFNKAIFTPDAKADS